MEEQINEKWLFLLRKGDHDAFGEFIDKYKETVFLCSRRLGLRADEVEDVASETFMAAFEGLKRYRGGSGLSTWIWSIAYRKGIDYLRKSKRKRQLEAEASEEFAGRNEDGPLSVVQGAERGEIVWEAVKRLPRLWGLAVIMRYREEKSVAEIAKIMDNNENTVKTYLFRGRERLREMLAGSLGESSDGD